MHRVAVASDLGGLLTVPADGCFGPDEPLPYSNLPGPRFPARNEHYVLQRLIEAARVLSFKRQLPIPFWFRFLGDRRRACRAECTRLALKHRSRTALTGKCQKTLLCRGWQTTRGSNPKANLVPV